MAVSSTTTLPKRKSASCQPPQPGKDEDDHQRRRNETDHDITACGHLISCSAHGDARTLAELLPSSSSSRLACGHIRYTVATACFAGV
jgi:hypothetical protein